MNLDPSYASARILIVDDDPDIVLSLQDFLGGDGYHVHVATSGHLAWDCVKQNVLDLVLLDVCLPDTDGLLLLEKLSQTFPGLPIIILSGLPSLDQVTGPLDQQGAFAYLKKPIDRGQLRTTVRLGIKAHHLARQMQRTQRALADSELRFQAIFQTANDAIILADTHGRITGWNPSAQSMFGYQEAEVFGQPLTLLMPIRYREAHTEGLKRFSLTKETKVIGKTVPLHGLKKNGEEFPIELSLNAWTTESETSYSGFIRDRSEPQTAIPAAS